MKIVRILWWYLIPKSAEYRGRLRLVRVEMATSRRDFFVSVALTLKLWQWIRGYREWRITCLGVQLHYRTTTMHAPRCSCRRGADIAPARRSPRVAPEQAQGTA
jgi:hypothetical protein